MLVADRPGAFSPRIAARASLKSPVEIPLRYSAGTNASTLGCPAHKAGKNCAGEPPSVTMPYPRLTNFNGTNSTHYLPLWQMPIAYNQPLAILITSILVELNVVHYLVFDRGLQQLTRSFLEQLFEKRLLFIFSSLTERDHFIL